MNETRATEVRAQVNAPRRLAGPAIVAGLILLCAAAIGWLLWQRGRALDRPTPAVAVLPFRNESTDPDNRYFSDGLTIELIDRLTKVENLRVVSWNSASRFRGQAGSLQELRNRLQAGSVVDGTVSRYGDRFRITTKLIDAVSGQTIWSDTYERPAKDIFQVEEEIAKSIVYALKVPLQIDPERILDPPRTESMEAFDDYLRARCDRNPFSKPGLSKSSEFAEKSIAEDPKYSPPYALLANDYALLGYYGVMPLSEAAAHAKDFARKAIALDSSSVEAHTALGFALGLADWNFKDAQPELNRAVQWSPGSAEAHTAMAIAYLVPMGKLEDAEDEARKAVQLDPLSFVANDVAGNVLLSRGKYQESIDHFKTALAIDSEFPAVHWDYGMALASAGRKDEARAQFIQACEVERKKSCDPGPVGYAILGESANSRALLEKEPPRPLEQARAWAILGDRDRAFAALGKALSERDPQLVFIQSDTRLANLRSDPRYEPFLKKLNLK